MRIRRAHPAECSVRLPAAAPWLLRDRPAGDLGGNRRNRGWLTSGGSTVACFSISVLVCAESAKCVEICPDKMLTWNGGATRMARSLLKSAGLHLCVCASVLGRGQDGQTQGTGRQTPGQLGLKGPLTDCLCPSCCFGELCTHLFPQATNPVRRNVQTFKHVFCPVENADDTAAFHASL